MLGVELGRFAFIRAFLLDACQTKRQNHPETRYLPKTKQRHESKTEASKDSNLRLVESSNTQERNCNSPSQEKDKAHESKFRHDCFYGRFRLCSLRFFTLHWCVKQTDLIAKSTIWPGKCGEKRGCVRGLMTVTEAINGTKAHEEISDIFRPQIGRRAQDECRSEDLAYTLRPQGDVRITCHSQTPTTILTFLR